MDENSINQSLEAYKNQLEQVELALENEQDDTDKNNLLSLKRDLIQLIDLTKENLDQLKSRTNIEDTAQSESHLDTEFDLFMAEMEKEGVATNKQEQNVHALNTISDELKALEGMKCRAPHVHQWGDTVYHNAMICSVPLTECKDFNEIQVKVLFMNPTHQEMLPCPYYLETDCKFSDEQCRYSHGETVAFSSLQEYIEPKFEQLTIGSSVLAKQPNKLWHRATIKSITDNKCTVKFDSNQKYSELELHDVLPLEKYGSEGSSDDSDDSEADLQDPEDIINMSLLNAPTDVGLGDWEKHTKGIGSKLMEKMGYVVGTGLGRRSDGRLDPVTAVILPAGKSLDHCMHLREKAGGDKDLFSVEKKLKRLQKKQEARNQKIYEHEKKKVDVFNLLNDTLLNIRKPESLVTTKKQHQEEIKAETSRNLNVASLKVDEDIKRVERDLYKIRESLTRHADVRTQMNKSLKSKLLVKQNELKTLHAKAQNIKTEQNLRSDKKKLTVF